MLSTAAFIIGMIILGLCVVAAAIVLSGAINGAASALKESAPQSMQQPTLTFLTEYDAADYLGISLNELDFIRSEGLLEGAFIAVTSLEQTGEENYVDYEDGVEVGKTRPIMSNVTRFLFNRQLLDEKMMEAIRSGKHINPFRSKAQEKKQGGKKNKSGSEGKKENKHTVVDLFAEENERAEKPEPEKEAPAEVKAEDTIPEKAEKPEKLSIEYVEPDEAEDEKQPEAPVEKKPAAAGPQMPMGPIGDDDDDDDVIDIMERINKNQNNRPNGNRPNGNRPNGNRPNGNRSNGNRPNGNRQNGNRSNGGRN